MLAHEYLPYLFKPRNVAVIGASSTPGKIGNIVMANLIRSEYKGKIFPVNPKGGVILDLEAIKHVGEIPKDSRPLDLAVICVPAQAVPDALDELSELPTRAIVVISAGFKEIGGYGVELEKKIKEQAQKYKMALLGPNCIGIVSSASNLNATFASGETLAGNIGFFSQSGALCTSIFDWSVSQYLGFSGFVSLGNKAVLSESDIMAHMADDPETRVIGGYLESVENGRVFLQNAQLATRKKPVVILKAGRTEAGQRAASSHTGALAGADLAYEAAFKQTGVIRAYTMEQLFSLTQAFATQPLPKGPGVAIVTNSGGPGIMATDACSAAGLNMIRPTKETVEALQKILPPFASLYNPIDVVGDAPPERIAKSVNIVMRDQNAQALLFLSSPTAMAPISEVARMISDTLEDHGKPIVACLMGGDEVVEGRKIFARAGIPCYEYPEPAVEAIATMFRYGQHKVKPLPIEVSCKRDRDMAAKVISEVRALGLCEVVEYQAQELLKAYGLPVLEAKLARTSEEAADIAEKIGGPVAMKIASPQISHKTDVRGVLLNLDTPEKVRSAFLDITSRAIRMRPEAYIAGCLVQAMAPSGAREVIVGVKRDSRFGPMIVFGLGGIHVEIFKDIASRLAPLSIEDVREMIREIKAYPLLSGIRGQKSIKFESLENILLIMSQLALDFPDIQEAECNPVLVNENGALVADIRVVLSPPPASGEDAEGK